MSLRHIITPPGEIFQRSSDSKSPERDFVISLNMNNDNVMIIKVFVTVQSVCSKICSKKAEIFFKMSSAKKFWLV